ncbi:hypothetical protein KKF55_02185 [Patescibacteria group bacterium]|nr:hypothetical protein [Patescibacteria group bacterium]
MVVEARSWVAEDRVDIAQVFIDLAAVSCQEDWTDRDEIAPSDLQVGVGCSISREAYTNLLDQIESSGGRSHTFQNRGYYVRKGTGGSRILVWYNEQGHGCRVLTPDELDRIPFGWKDCCVSGPIALSNAPYTEEDHARIREALCKALIAEDEKYGSR